MTLTITNKTPKIFLDASIVGNTVGVGLFEMISGKSHYVKVKTTKHLGSDDAETIALKHALEFSKQFGNPAIQFFTDNHQVYKNHREVFESCRIPGKCISIHWVPRELNQFADELSKKARDKSSINKSETVKEVRPDTISNINKYLRDMDCNKKETFLRNVFKSKGETALINEFFNATSLVVKTKAEWGHFKDFAIVCCALFGTKDRKRLKMNDMFDKLSGNKGFVQRPNKVVEDIIRKTMKNA